MPFKFVADDIMDHSPLDAMVYETFKSDGKELPVLKYLLTEVVNSASDKMDKKFRDIAVAKQILEEYS